TQTMNALVDVQDTVGKELYSDSEITVKQQKIVILSIILIGLLFTVILSWIITRAIGTPMRALQDAASDIANGNTAIHIQAQYKDEIGMLGRAFITMANNLDKLFHDIRQKSAQAEEAAEQAEKARRQALEQQEYLSRKVDEILVQMESLAIGDLTARLPLEQGVRGNDSLSRLFKGFNATVNSIRELVSQLISATHQTGMVSVSMSSLAEEISAIVEEQSAQTTFISDSTKRMAQSIHTNSQNVASVKDITLELSHHVMNLNTSSNKINVISRSIGSIAFQINLLSLNASIEAARAGRAGKGFAVVAAEVKSLAQSTARSTDEIRTIVEEVQGRIDEITAMTLERAKSSSDSTTKRNVVEMVAEISTAMEEQSGASAEIAQNTQQISLAAQQTALSVSHITRTAEELTQLTEKLQNLVGKFILDDDTKPHSLPLQRRNDLFLA
ncbi:MAG: methyl-accepting chemotaxis protein, partial [Candidatus Kapaibacteriota bacterium]